MLGSIRPALCLCCDQLSLDSRDGTSASRFWGQPPRDPRYAGQQPAGRLAHRTRSVAVPTVLYRLLFRLVLQNIRPEAAHAGATRVMRIVETVPALSWLLRKLIGPPDPALQVRTLGLTFPSPLGVAAGMDKDATWFEGLGDLGFGFVEVGTITARPQQGNPRPRVWRLSEDQALLNSMGFPNPGADATAARLRDRRGRTIIGANLGKSMTVSIEDAGRDYAESVGKVAPLSDYVVLNVSSPNTPGLRTMQGVERLGGLIANVRQELARIGCQVPLLIKIAPDLSDEELDAIADLALALELDGIVAVNTTVERTGLASGDAAILARAGGISGPPLRARAIYVLERLRARVGDALVLVSVGGITTPDDAWQRVLAGATLVQAYTGLVYGGPSWPRHINRGLSKRVREAGFKSLHDAIGAGVKCASIPQAPSAPTRSGEESSARPRHGRLPVGRASAAR
jgi:dihydroorotate dehydrogenase